MSIPNDAKPLVISEEHPIDGLGDLALEAPQGFLPSLGFSKFALVVGLAGIRMYGLHPGSEMQGVVELAVARSREAVPDDRSAGGLDRSGSGVAGKSDPHS